MTAMSATHAREVFSELVNRTAYGKERVVLTRRGKQIAALVPVEDLELLESLEDQRDLADAIKAEKKAAKKGEAPISWAKARKLLSK